MRPVRAGLPRLLGRFASVCECFAASIAETLPPDEVGPASQLFRSDGRFATTVQDGLAQDVRATCLPG